MTQFLIEKAIANLNTLLSQKEYAEPLYQKYFESHPIVFELMGYKNMFPHIELITDNKDSYIPDFILEREDGLYEVCDIKLPNEKIIKYKKNRDEFYAKIGTDFAGQLRNYSNYFDDSKNRKYILEKYGLNINKAPQKILIVGRNKNIDRFLLHEILTSRGHEFALITYDDILEHLHYSLNKSFLSEKQFFGTSLLIILKLLPNDTNHNQYIIDLGDDESCNRFSIYLDENNNLCFRVIDKFSNDIVIKAFFNRQQYQQEEYFYLHCSVGCSSEYSIMEMYINGNRLEKREMHYCLYKSRGFNFNQRFFAVDINNQNGVKAFFEIIKCYNHNLNFHDRNQEDSEFFNRLSWVKKQIDLCTMYFGENAFVEIPLQEGQTSTVPRGLEGLWDIHTLYFNGKSFLDYRIEKGQVY